MIDRKDFERLASRYADSETSTGETESVRQLLLTDTEAQKDLERIELEGEWLSRAFSRPVEDISRVVIKIRARNPHKPTYVSPLLMLLAQIVTLAGLGFAMSLQTGDLIPPRVIVASQEGEVKLGQDILAQARGRLPFDSPLSVGRTGQLTIQIGAADSLMLAPQTTASVQQPRAGVRHVSSLTSGEVWGRLVDSQTPFVLLLPGGAEVQGSRFELNAGTGNAALNMLPRGVDPLPEPDAVVRIMEGVATVRLGDASQLLRPGSVAIIRNRTITEVSDPDASHYRALRLTPAGEFRSNWNWLNEDRLPLAREVATYALWKSLRELETKISGARADAMSRDYAAEIADFRQSATRAIEEARAWERKQNRPNGAPTPGPSPLLASPESVANRATLLQFPAAAETDPGPDVLLAFASHVETLFQRWDAEEIDVVALYASGSISNVHRALANMLSDAEQAARRVVAQEVLHKAAADRVKRAQDDLDKAIETVKQREGAERRDPDSSKREALTGEIEELEAQILALEAKERQAEFVRVEAAPASRRVDALVTQIAAPQRELARLKEQRAAIQARLDANTFKEEQLQAATAEVGVVIERVSTLKSREDKTSTDREAASAHAATVREGVTAALNAMAEAENRRDAKAEELAAAVSASHEADAELDRCVTALAEAQAAFDALPEEQRKDSPEAAALAEAQLAHQTALSRAAAAAAVIPAIRERKNNADLAVERAMLNHGEAAAKQPDADKALAEAEARLQSLRREIADAERHLEEVRKIEADLQRSKIDRAAIEAELGEMDRKIAPVDTRVTELSQQLAAERATLRPVQERLEGLLREIEQLPTKRGALASKRRDYNAHESTEQLLVEARLKVLAEQTELLVAWDALVSRMTSLSAALGGRGRAVPPEAAEARVARAEIMEEIAEDGSWRPGLMIDPIAEATNQGVAALGIYLRHHERELELNEISRLRLRAKHLSLAWLRALAAASEDRALAEDARRVNAYRAQRDALLGFGEEDPSPETVYGVLLAEAKRSRIEKADKVDADGQKRLFQAMWKLFASTDISSERERRRASLDADVRGAAPSAASSSAAYLPILLADPASIALNSIHSQWNVELVRVIGAE